MNARRKYWRQPDLLRGGLRKAISKWCRFLLSTPGYNYFETYPFEHQIS